MAKYTAIVLSAGKGTRMGTKISKQYLEIKGKPILYYTLKAFEESCVDEIIVVAGKDDLEFVKREIIEKYQIKKIKKIVAGGKERYDSVINGLQYVNDGFVLIHDGARPLIKSEDINKISDKVLEYKACVAAVPVKDTIKIVNDEFEVIETPLRKYVWQIQTPQAFSVNIIKNAYEKMTKNQNTSITDDAMVVEKYSDYKVKVIELGYYNIKITTPEDLEIMKNYIE